MKHLDHVLLSVMKSELVQVRLIDTAEILIAKFTPQLSLDYLRINTSFAMPQTP